MERQRLERRLQLLAKGGDALVDGGGGEGAARQLRALLGDAAQRRDAERRALAERKGCVEPQPIGEDAQQHNGGALSRREAPRALRGDASLLRLQVEEAHLQRRLQRAAQVAHRLLGLLARPLAARRVLLGRQQRRERVRQPQRARGRLRDDRERVGRDILEQLDARRRARRKARLERVAGHRRQVVGARPACLEQPPLGHLAVHEEEAAADVAEAEPAHLLAGKPVVPHLGVVLEAAQQPVKLGGHVAQPSEHVARHRDVRRVALPRDWRELCPPRLEPEECLATVRVARRNLLRGVAARVWVARRRQPTTQLEPRERRHAEAREQHARRAVDGARLGPHEQHELPHELGAAGAARVEECRAQRSVLDAAERRRRRRRRREAAAVVGGAAEARDGLAESVHRVHQLELLEHRVGVAHAQLGAAHVAPLAARRLGRLLLEHLPAARAPRRAPLGAEEDRPRDRLCRLRRQAERAVRARQHELLGLAPCGAAQPQPAGRGGARLAGAWRA